MGSVILPYLCYEFREMKYKNLIFDLGNVIIDLDVPKGNRQMKETTGIGFLDATDEDLETFYDFEKGLIPEAIFINYFIRRSLKPVQALDVIRAWNAMLVQIPLERLLMMRDLMDHFNVYVLSNTNETHVRWMGDYLLNTHDVDSLNSFAHKIFFSHELKLRKPDFEIYEAVLNQTNSRPEETIFFDDHLRNIEAAKSVGMEAVQVDPKDEIIHIVDQVLFS